MMCGRGRGIHAPPNTCAATGKHLVRLPTERQRAERLWKEQRGDERREEIEKRDRGRKGTEREGEM